MCSIAAMADWLLNLKKNTVNSWGTTAHVTTDATVNGYDLTMGPASGGAVPYTFTVKRAVGADVVFGFVDDLAGGVDGWRHGQHVVLGAVCAGGCGDDRCDAEVHHRHLLTR